MNTGARLIHGGIYQTNLSSEPVRVLAFDKFEVHYDAYWSSLDKWTFASSLKRRGIYYRTSPGIFLKDAIFIREQALTEDELKVFRPDLPMRLCRYKHIWWSDKTFQTLDEYKIYLSQFNIEISDQIVLPACSITLEPFGSKKRTALLKSALVSSTDVNGFTEIELLWQANNVQVQYAKHIVEKGVGIYRKGHEKKVPSYYIWDYYDAAGRLKNDK